MLCNRASSGSPAEIAHVARFILLGVYTGTRHDAILKPKQTADLGGGCVDIQ